MDKFLSRQTIGSWLKLQRLAFFLGMLVLLLVSAKSNLAYLTLRNAVGGFSPVDYVQITSNPQAFENRFPNGVEVLGNSLVFHIYELAYHVRLDPELVQRMIIVLTVFLFAFSLYFFSRSLLPSAPRVVHFLTVLFGLGTHVLNHDLARFSDFAGLPFGQMYGFAAVGALLAIGWAFRESWAKCWMLVGVVFIFHPSMAIYTFFACGAVAFAKPRVILTKSFWRGSFTGLAIALIWAVLIILPSLRDFPVMSTEDWINWSRFGNFHWYPFSLQVFQQEHFRRITPLLSIILLAFLRLRDDGEITKEGKIKWIFAFSSLLILTISGLLASLYVSSPTVMKISLHRASMFLLALSLPLSLSLLWSGLEKGKLAEFFLACVLLLSPVIGQPSGIPFLKGTWGFPLFFSIFLCGVDYYYQPRKTTGWYLNFLICAVIFVAVLMTGFLLFRSYANWDHPAFMGYLSVIVFSLIFALTIFILPRISRQVFPQKTQWLFFLVTLCVIFNAASTLKSSASLVPWRNLEKATAYYEAQLWAKGNTEPGSLFWVDPGINYGWEGYSQRPKFGSFRDWIHTGWLYTGNRLNFDEGLRRVRLLGVEPSHFLLKSLENGKISVGPDYREFEREVQKAFYSLNENTFKKIAAKEGIRYVVLDKQKTKGLPLPSVYENTYFVIYRVDSI